MGELIEMKSLSLLLLSLSGHLWAQSTFYTDRNAFMAACANLQGTKQSLSFAGYSSSWWGDSLAVSNVTFSGHLIIRPQGDPIAIANTASLNNYDSGIPLSIHFATGALAFGADFSSLLFPYNTSNFSATIKVQGAADLTFSAAPGPGSTFFGFIQSSPFQDLTFSDGGALSARQGWVNQIHEELIGNPFMVVGVSSVPEPTTMSLCLLGLLAVWFLVRNRNLG